MCCLAGQTCTGNVVGEAGDESFVDALITVNQGYMVQDVTVPKAQSAGEIGCYGSVRVRWANIMC